MSVTGSYLNDIGQLADKLTKEFAALPFDQFVQDTKKIESAVMRLTIIREGCTCLPSALQEELVNIDWCTVAGRWDWQERRHVGIDSRQLWETLVWRLPQMSRKVQELLKVGV
jgi:uncharacterized protein with HEPN domain